MTDTETAPARAERPSLADAVRTADEFAGSMRKVHQAANAKVDSILRLRKNFEDYIDRITGRRDARLTAAVKDLHARRARSDRFAPRGDE